MLPRPSRRVLDGVGLAARLGLAAVWLVSGTIKVLDPAQTRVAIQAYEVLPGALVEPAARTLPLLELILGTLLLVGAFTRWAAIASVALLVVLMTGIAQAWARGLSIDCGCFGGGGVVAEGSTRYPQELARDAGLLALALWLTVRPATLMSIDRWLGTGADTAVVDTAVVDTAVVDTAVVDTAVVDTAEVDTAEVDTAEAGRESQVEQKHSAG